MARKKKNQRPELSAESCFRKRASRANIGRAKRILARAGRGNPPVPGDER